jgi:alkylhydroperoxidase/carboxymuconolactone decarboxylase family protein YurZ
MDSSEDVLRELAMHDEAAIKDALAIGPDVAGDLAIDASTCALIRLAALVSLDAPDVCYQPAVAHALAAGASTRQIVDTLRAIVPVAGPARVVGAAASVALAIGYDIAAALEAYESTTWPHPA